MAEHPRVGIRPPGHDRFPGSGILRGIAVGGEGDGYGGRTGPGVGASWTGRPGRRGSFAQGGSTARRGSRMVSPHAIFASPVLAS